MDSAALRGVFPALVTPFFDDYSLDLRSYSALIEYVVGAGACGIVACGSTGEAATLDDDEYLNVIRHARAEATRLNVPCIAGIGSNNTKRAVVIAQELKEIGVDGILLVTPPYNKPPQAGIVEHFRAVHGATALPIIAYNVPGRTGVNLQPKTVARLAEERLIIALKESSGDLDQVATIASLVGDSIALLSGEDALVVPTCSLGGVGVVSVTANVVPEKIVMMVQHALAGRMTEARALQLSTLALTHALFSETNPIPVKAALAIRRVITSAAVRLPLIQAQHATVAALRELL